MTHRRALASWPDAWRQRWGIRANQLEDAGHGWREAEERAFAEVSAEKARPLVEVAAKVAGKTTQGTFTGG